MWASAGWADGTAQSAGTLLLNTPSARAAALGESFTAIRNDVAGLFYNPSSLNSLKTPQAAFQYQKGLVDDSYGQLAIGGPTKKGSLGLGLGYYNGGEFNLSNGNSVSSVRAKSELLLSVAGARALGPMSVGATFKYLSSTLAETATANAIAVDLGAGFSYGKKLNLGAALQNIGTALKYGEGSDPLPRIARAGVSTQLMSGQVPLMMVFDVPYYMNEKEMRPSIGFESNVGPLALRTGYKTGADLQEFSVGAGFLMGSTTLDYSFGFAQKLDSTHRVSVSMRFGLSQPPVPEIVLRKERTVVDMPVVSYTATPEKKPAPETTAAKSKPTSVVSLQLPGQYQVKAGETLENIAKRVYGSSKYWTIIYDANEELITDPETLELTGQKLWLPNKPAEGGQ
jgi:LysM repeat protein